MRQIAEVIQTATMLLVSTIILVNVEGLIPNLILAAIAIFEVWSLGRAVNRVSEPTVHITQTINRPRA